MVLFLVVLIPVVLFHRGVAAESSVAGIGPHSTVIQHFCTGIEPANPESGSQHMITWSSMHAKFGKNRYCCGVTDVGFFTFLTPSANSSQTLFLFLKYLLTRWFTHSKGRATLSVKVLCEILQICFAHTKNAIPYYCVQGRNCSCCALLKVSNVTEWKDHNFYEKQHSSEKCALWKFVQCAVFKDSGEAPAQPKGWQSLLFQGNEKWREKKPNQSSKPPFHKTPDLRLVNACHISLSRLTMTHQMENP